MISDEILSAAAGEVAAAMAASCSDCGHVFSRGFERKMEHLIRRAAHPVRHRVLRYAAAIVLAAVTAFGSLYLLSPTVRAVVNSWIKTTYGSYIQYYSENTTPPEQQYDYFLPEEFDGYILVDGTEDIFGRTFIYAHSDGRILLFDYMRSSNSSGLFLDAENCVHSTVSIGAYTGDLYLSKDPTQTSVIVWVDESTGTMLSISAVADREQLIHVAQKVEKIQKKIKMCPKSPL